MKKIGLLEVLGRDRRQSAEVEIFGKSKEKWLKKYIKLEDGIPDTYTFRNIVKATPSRRILDGLTAKNAATAPAQGAGTAGRDNARR